MIRGNNVLMRPLSWQKPNNEVKGFENHLGFLPHVKHLKVSIEDLRGFVH